MKAKQFLPIILVILLSAIAIPMMVKFFSGGEGGSRRGTPEITGIHAWINTEKPLRISRLQGKVVLVDFWTYSCINCLRTLPYLNAWHEKYRGQGLVIIGIHSPEFNFEKDLERVKKAVASYHIRYPVALDSEKKTWDAFRNRFWPHKYLIDSGGNLRYEQIGEGNYTETEEKIRELLVEAGYNLDLPMTQLKTESVDFKQIKTPEIYFGKYQGQFLGNPLGLVTGRDSFYREPPRIEENLYYLSGYWNVGGENARYEGEDEGRISIRYTAKSLNWVAGTRPEQKIIVEVFLDGKPLKQTQAGRDILFDGDGQSYLSVRENRLYYVVSDPEGYRTHTLMLKVKGKGLEAYTFTFG
ncbi:MAG: thioredoxin family protein [Nitrospirae bacterium]|nr:thioredoxin family protein [Nitrospirota bacterium]